MLSLLKIGTLDFTDTMTQIKLDSFQQKFSLTLKAAAKMVVKYHRRRLLHLVGMRLSWC